MAEKGYNCVLSVGNVAIAQARSVTPNLEQAEMDVTTRADAPWYNWIGGIKNLTFSAEYLAVLDQAGILAIKTALLNDSDLAFVLEDSQGYGYGGTCGVLSISSPENMDDAVWATAEFKARGTVVARAPAS